MTEQEQKDEAEFNIWWEKIKKALVATREDAIQHRLGVGHGGTGFVKCPVCEDGTLKYSVAGLNGHLWGCYTTEGCVKWMQ